MYDKSSPMEIINGEMVVFGQVLPRHPEFPWLFSATHLHKFCKNAIRATAVLSKRDPDKFYEAKRPAQWIRRNILGKESKERVEHYAEHTRRRIKKYGPNLGFASRRNSTVSNVTVENMEDLEVVCVTINGGPMRGSYLCQLAIIKYIETFSEKFRAKVQDTFIAVANGEVEEVTQQVEENARRAKGSKERQEHKEQNYRLIKACGDKQLLAVHPQKGINLATLGMTAKKYKEKTGATEPLNDNLPVGLVRERAVAVEMTAKAIEDNPSAKISPKEGVKIGFKCGVMAKQVLVDREAQELLFRNGLRSSKHARAVAKKYGLV